MRRKWPSLYRKLINENRRLAPEFARERYQTNPGTYRSNEAKAGTKGGNLANELVYVGMRREDDVHELIKILDLKMVEMEWSDLHEFSEAFVGRLQDGHFASASTLRDETD